MATLALFSHLLFSFSYNATITAHTVALFFPYVAYAAHYAVEDKVVEEIELRSLIL